MFVDSTLEQFQETLGLADVSSGTVALVTTTLLLSAALAYRKLTEEKVEGKIPPVIPSTIPFLGHAVSFGSSPIEFLLAAYEKYGPVFSFTMVGKTFTYLVGSEASALMFNSKNENLNAEEVYSRLVTPVFGKGVAYDIPNSIFLEQKKMFKTGLNIARFREHVHIIENETKDYFKRWGTNGTNDLFVALSELIILTASHCLHGRDIRERLDEHIAQLYADLDGGFTHLAWLLPGWLPFPSFRKRDKAQKEMKQIFHEIIQKRRANPNPDDDMLQTLIDAKYKSGRSLSDEEISGMLIGLLLAGQHTSSTTSTWMGFFLAKDKELQKRVYEEQLRVCGEGLAPVDYDQLKDMQLLDRCLKETLRLRPPIMTMMRMCKTPQNILGYTIPPGHQVCVSPTTNHRLPGNWKDFDKFLPDRFIDPEVANSEKFAYIPFGAGRHRCIGESFAYVQIKTIFSYLIRKYEFDLVDDYFPEVNVSTMIHTPSKPLIRYQLRKP
ncbi:lanosterol 14-alpha demethylase [Biomphalaria pfeifferi]|uniref:Lanosterol 14-alpha demethylase n=1 Tax=Biomphalaria pfeifferi TaxID=112525 RepID=A0AAD8BHE5_BIOPF|nr:lanosterol 14-alpha demethylase [Biomphalaria pfeifferi]